MEFEWDLPKATSNLKKHAIDFADAVTVLYDNIAVTIHDETDEENRFVTIGMDAIGRLLVLVYAWRRDRVRIISARKATRRERGRYGG